MFFSTLLKSLDMKVGEVSDPGLSSNGKPLDGVRILAVEQMQSLPFATQLLARLGADVVKVEHPVRGDLGRGSQPSVPDSNGESVGATFLRNNLNKRSIGLNLKDPAAQDIFLALAPKFDVVAENFRPGAMVSFGLGYDQVAAASPEVIYLSVSGFGNSGDSPYTHWPAFAPVAEAMSGMYNVNRAADEPIKVSPAGALGDTGTGLFAAVGILAALRHRDRTGIGQHIDISMFDSMVSFADLVPNYLSLGKDPRTPTEIINHGFPIANGDIVIQIGREHQFQRLVEVLDQPEWLTDNRFASRKGWLDNIEVIRSAIYLWAGNRSSVEVADALAAAGIAAAPVFTASDVVTDPHVANRNMVMSYSLTDGGPEVMTPGNPVKLSKVAEGPDTPPPSLGQQTNDILREELNLSLDEITTLRDSGVVR